MQEIVYRYKELVKRSTKAIFRMILHPSALVDQRCISLMDERPCHPLSPDEQNLESLGRP